jgi:hypothetical protein
MQLTHAVGWLCLAVVTPGAFAQTLLRSIVGPPNSHLGQAVLHINDRNGDGYDDLLVGAPAYNSSRGMIYCVSGAYLATGSGSSTLWILAPAAANPGDQFGYSLADVGDITGDGVSDFLVGMPGYDFGTSTDSGAVRLVDGSTLALVSLIYDDTPSIAFGSAMATCGDFDGDGVSEVVVGAPGPSPFFTQVFVLDGWTLATSGSNVALHLASIAMQGSGYAFGVSLASGFDLDGDGLQEIAVGAPGRDAPGATDAGECRILSIHYGVDSQGNALWTLHTVGLYSSSVAGERLGTSVDAKHDYDGDGVVDIVAGAPNWLDGNVQEAGRVVVLSGAKMLANTAPYEISTLTLPFGSQFFDYHFGATVRASADLNHDGVGEIFVGAPDYTTVGAGGSIQNKGLVAIFSGATGSRCATITGSSGDLLGDSTTGAFQDFDGDGFKEFVVAGSLSDAGGTDSGVLKCYRLFPIAPAAYCTGKINSLGCTPAISFTGSPKAIPSAPFLITASNFLNQKSGLLFYSHRPSSTTFQGGFKCAGDPVQRTDVLDSGGATSGSSCTGTYSLDFNARIQSGVDTSLVAGAEVFAQYWSRDPQSASTTSLSNALRLVINP